MTPLTDVQQVLAYHEDTKHHPHRYARSMGYVDWASQPNPFRSWEGTEVIRLPLLERDADIPYEHLYERGKRQAAPFNVKNIGAFLELSLAISAWKRSEGTQWALRVNPSSGNLHPTEAYLLLPSIEGLAGGVFHYNSFLHALERRASVPQSLDEVLKEHFKASGFLLLLTTIYWRESWKYGERGFRYCHHDAGHALAACAVSGNLLGWNSTFVTAAVSAMLARTRKYGRPSFTSSTCIHALDVWHMFFILSIPTPYGISAGIPSKTSILACSPVVLVSSTLRTSAPIFSPGSVK